MLRRTAEGTVATPLVRPVCAQRDVHTQGMSPALPELLSPHHSSLLMNWVLAGKLIFYSRTRAVIQ